MPGLLAASLALQTNIPAIPSKASKPQLVADLVRQQAAHHEEFPSLFQRRRKCLCLFLSGHVRATIQERRGNYRGLLLAAPTIEVARDLVALSQLFQLPPGNSRHA